MKPLTHELRALLTSFPLAFSTAERREVEGDVLVTLDEIGERTSLDEVRSLLMTVFTDTCPRARRPVSNQPLHYLVHDLLKRAGIEGSLVEFLDLLEQRTRTP